MVTWRRQPPAAGAKDQARPSIGSDGHCQNPVAGNVQRDGLLISNLRHNTRWPHPSKSIRCGPPGERIVAKNRFFLRLTLSRIPSVGCWFSSRGLPTNMPSASQFDEHWQQRKQNYSAGRRKNAGLDANIPLEAPALPISSCNFIGSSFFFDKNRRVLCFD